MNRPIGVFDSGVGGLTVLKSLIESLPNEDYVYLGDTANVPYGVREPEDIKNLAINAHKKLRDLDIKALVIGCNTATVHGLDGIREIADVPVIGIIDPGVELVLKNNVDNLLILATESTVNSGLIQSKLNSQRDINIQGIGAPDMVMAVEKGEAKTDIGYEVVKKYLDKSTKEEESVLLACTHFPAMSENIKKYYDNIGKDILLINPADGITEALKKEVELSDNTHGSIKYYTTGDPVRFKNSGNIVLGEELIEKVEIL